jgi:uncharacterized membrane protein YccC
MKIDVKTVIVLRAAILSMSCVITFWLITHILAPLYSVSREDDLLGGMWAVAATVFVYRDSHAESMGAALSRMAATLVSFALCFVYLIFLPFNVWGMAALIGIGTIVVTMMGRPNDTITTSITTAVVLVVAAIGPHDAWRQPPLRLIDTGVGVAVGVAAGWISGSSTLYKATSFWRGTPNKAGA